MKHLIFTTILFINSGIIVAQNSKVDTLVRVTWNGNAWQNYFRTINSYDADCRLKTALSQNWDGATGKWVDDSIGTYSYVSGNYISEILTRFWFNNSWTNNFRQTYTYDISFKTLSVLGQTWSSDHWSDYKSTSYKYDNNGYADSVLEQLSYAEGPFENTHLNIYITNADGTLQQTVNQTWNKATSSWDNFSKYSFVYNNHATIDTAFEALWDYNAASWQFQTRSIYTYTAAGKLSYYITQRWQTSQWVNQWLYTNYYDNNGFLSTVIGEQFDGFDFEKFSQTIYINNNDGTIYQHLTQIWVEAMNAWVNSSRETYSYPAACLLPLKLLLFTATKNNNTIDVNWQTTAEINISYFTIQRNPDGTDFTSLGDTPARNGTATNSYEYSDNIEGITADKISYRLKIIDKDGAYTYSKIVSVIFSVYAGGLKVYPNPAKDQLLVLFKMQNTGKAELRINDISGKIIYSNTVNTNQGNGTASVNISSLSTGMYYVMLITGNDIQRTQFVKQ